MRYVAACLLAIAAVLLLSHGYQHETQRVQQPAVMYSRGLGYVELTKVDREERGELRKDLRMEEAKEKMESHKEPFHVAKKWTLSTEEDDMNDYFDRLQVVTLALPVRPLLTVSKGEDIA
eukprot:755752-Hanusia_phi.AAC.2